MIDFNSCKRALVLSGGGTYGYYHVGALQHLLRHEQPYDIYAGTSVGAIISGALAQFATGEEEHALTFLEDVMLTLSRKDIFRFQIPFPWRRSIFDSKPLHKTVHQHLNRNRIRSSGKCLRVAMTNAFTGAVVHATESDFDIVDCVIASASIPGAFEPTSLRSTYFVDGGLKANTPISAAIMAGATSIDVITLAPERPVALPSLAWPLVALTAAQTAGIELLTDDAENVRRVNDLVQSGLAPEYRYIDIRVLRPQRYLPSHPLDFDRKVASAIRRMGYEDAQDKNAWR